MYVHIKDLDNTELFLSTDNILSVARLSRFNGSKEEFAVSLRHCVMTNKDYNTSTLYLSEQTYRDLVRKLNR